MQVDHSDIKAMTTEIQKIGVYQPNCTAGGQYGYGRYEKLQGQKEALYTDYDKLKKQVAEYDVIKRNIGSILQTEYQPEKERQKNEDSGLTKRWE